MSKIEHADFLKIVKRCLGPSPRLDSRENLAQLVRSKGTEIFINYDWLNGKGHIEYCDSFPELEVDGCGYGFTLKVKQEVRIIIAGSRTITDLMHVDDAVKAAGYWITEVVSGGATGPDQLGEVWAKNHGVPVKHFLADWDKGKHAGMVRNEEMRRYADGLIAVWDGESKGTAHMIKQMKDNLRPHYVHLVEVTK